MCYFNWFGFKAFAQNEENNFYVIYLDYIKVILNKTSSINKIK